MTRRRTIAEQELHGNGRPPAHGSANPAQQPPRSGPRLQSVRARDLAVLPVDWLWRNYVPRGAVTLIDGDPGTGKSQLTIDVAARISRGWAMPPAGGAGEAVPAGVLFLSAEDDPARTIRPRLDAAGADLDRVVIVGGVNGEKFGRPVSLPEDLDLIRSAAKEIDAALVVFDPLMAFLTGAIDSHKDSDVRRVLHELKRFGEETGAAVLIVRHLNKMTSVSAAMYRGGGSIGIIGAARSAFVVGRHPDDPNVRVLAGVKCNLGPMPAALAFGIEPAGDTSRVGWIGEVDLIADQVIQHRGPGRPREDTSKAVALLQELLATGPKAAAVAVAAAKQQGISERTLKRAKKELKVITRKPGGVWTWALRDPPAGQGGQNLPNTRILAPLAESPEKSPEIQPGNQGGQNSCVPAAAGYIAPDLDTADPAYWERMAALDAQWAAEHPHGPGSERR